MNGSNVNRVTAGAAAIIPIHDGIDPDRLQPHREERQIGAAQAERRAVKQASATPRIACGVS